MRAIGVNRRPADNRLAAAVPTARRAAAALGGTVLQTATDQRRAVKDRLVRAPRRGHSPRLREPSVTPTPDVARERDRAGVVLWRRSSVLGPRPRGTSAEPWPEIPFR